MIRSPTEPHNRGGSQPDLSKINTEEFRLAQVTLRKRKEPEKEGLKADFADFRKEIMDTLNGFVETQKEILNKISDDVTVIKDEMKSLQSITRELVSEQNRIKSDIVDLKLASAATNTKVDNIETDLRNLKTAPPAELEFECLTCEDVVSELHERELRSKNIIIVGIPEAKNDSKEERAASDSAEVNKIIKTIFPECPEPVKIHRLGYFKPEKIRHIKVYLSSQENAKVILRKKSIYKNETVKIYSDQTPYQQKFMKKLTEELQNRIQSGEKDLLIKYVNNTPKIIHKPSKN